MNAQQGLKGLEDARFQNMALTFRVMRLASIWRTRLERALRPHGMTVALMRPMAYLMMMPGGATQRALAQAMDTDCSALVRILDLLEKEGFIARHPDEQDRRAKRITLTRTGQQRCAIFHDVAAQLEQDMTATMPPEQLPPLISQLDLLLSVPPEPTA